MVCEKTQACPMMKLFRTEASLAVWKAMYCESGFERCERLKLARSGIRPDDRMLPNGSLLPEPPPRG
ncbi:MAG: hypothetical protein U0229_25495 [Anaeromyxobacter sp.]